MKTYLSLLILIVSMTAKAADSEQSIGSMPSLKNREQKQWGFAGQAGNITVGGLYGTGVGGSLMYYLNRNNVLSAEVGASTNYDFTSSLGGDTVTGSEGRVGLYYQHFTGNSFYFKVGAEGTKTHYSVVHYETIAGYKQAADINVYSGYLALGNEWQMDRLTIGCDWVGGLLPFANSNFSETDSGTPTDAWDLHSKLTGPRMVIGRFYIGMIF